MKSIFIFLMIMPKAFGMYGYTIPNYEKIAINQTCIASCWAATAEAVYNYINTDSKTSQNEIILNNPNVYGNNYCIPAILSPDYFLGHPDYLVDSVLSNDQYRGDIQFNPGINELEFIKTELKKNKPMIMFFDFHARVVYGYFQLGNQTYLKLFNPARYFIPPWESFDSWEIINYENVLFRKFLGRGNESVALFYMKERFL